MKTKLIVAVVGISVMLAALFMLFKPAQTVTATPTSNLTIAEANKIINQHGDPSAPRLKYRLSVIPGGVTTVEEFNMKVSQDSALSALACPEAKAETAPADMVVFTTFRRGNKILWNRRPIAVKKGEKIIVGCGRTVLMRCGNQISFTSQEPSETLPPGILENPINPPQEAPPIVSAPPAETLPPTFHAGTSIETTENFGGGYVTVPIFGGGSFGPTPPAVTVPEPPTALLLSVGLAAFGLLTFWRK